MTSDHAGRDVSSPIRTDDPLAPLPRLTLQHSGAAADGLAQLLRQVSISVLKHPVAAQAIFSAFVAEGRRFAQTPEGQRWRVALADSELVRRGRALWEASALNMLEDSPGTVIPTAILDAVVHAVSAQDLDRALLALTHADVADVAPGHS